MPQIALGGSGSSGGASSADESGEVPRIPASELSYERFCLEYMEANRPVILQVGACLRSWCSLPLSSRHPASALDRGTACWAGLLPLTGA